MTPVDEGLVRSYSFKVTITDELLNTYSSSNLTLQVQDSCLYKDTISLIAGLPSSDETLKYADFTMNGTQTMLNISFEPHAISTYIADLNGRFSSILPTIC